MATEQIGEAGDILADQILRHIDCPVSELLARIRAGEPPPTDLRPALYLEWYSDRNGRVVIQATRLGVERLGSRTFESTAPSKTRWRIHRRATTRRGKALTKIRSPRERCGARVSRPRT